MWCVYNGMCILWLPTPRLASSYFHLSHLLFPSFPPLLIFSRSPPLNLPMKSTLAMGNYNEQLHMAAPPAAEIRQGSTAYTHTHTHRHTSIPYLISIVTEQPPSAQFCPNLLRKQYWYFTTVHNERRRRGGQRGGRGRRKGPRQQDRCRRIMWDW